MQKKRYESVHLCEAGLGCLIFIQISKKILKESGGGIANTLTAQVIQKHLADILAPHNLDTLRIDEILAG
ncbi:g2695 [Coccomyxa elongata]